MYTRQVDQDSQELRRVTQEEVEVHRILKRRQQQTHHFAYGVVASILGATTLIVWGFIAADARRSAEEPLTQSYAAFLSFAIFLGISASASALTWAIVWDGRKQAAEDDRIREFHEDRQVRALRDAIGVFLREGDADAREAMAQAQRLINGTDGGTVHQFRSRG